MPTNLHKIDRLRDHNEPLPPFLKWAGGKRWLAPLIQEKIGKVKRLYIEPFLGSGAIFFSLSPRRALLNDTNAELINAYDAIKKNYPLVVNYLQYHQKHHSQKYYYKLRDYRPRCPYRQAARFIYLNRTCWNGLYRVNLKGIFNVPKGSKEAVLLSSDCWPEISAALQSAELIHGDFESVIDIAKRGDLIFADPPYTIKHNYNGFIKYNESLFSWADQERLSLALTRAEKRGAIIIATNANHSSVRKLYEEHFTLSTLKRMSVLSGAAKFRGNFQELLICSKNIYSKNGSDEC